MSDVAGVSYGGEGWAGVVGAGPAGQERREGPWRDRGTDQPMKTAQKSRKKDTTTKTMKTAVNEASGLRGRVGFE